MDYLQILSRNAKLISKNWRGGGGGGGGHQEGEKGVGGEGCNTIYWPTLPSVS